MTTRRWPAWLSLVGYVPLVLVLGIFFLVMFSGVVLYEWLRAKVIRRSPRR